MPPSSFSHFHVHISDSVLLPFIKLWHPIILLPSVPSDRHWSFPVRALILEARLLLFHCVPEYEHYLLKFGV